jgi:hypothetical protein
MSDNLNIRVDGLMTEIRSLVDTRGGGDAQYTALIDPSMKLLEAEIKRISGAKEPDLTSVYKLIDNIPYIDLREWLAPQLKRLVLDAFTPLPFNPESVTVHDSDLRRYYDIIQPYKVFYPHYLRIGNDFTVYMTYKSEGKPYTVEEMNAQKPLRGGINPYHLVERVCFGEMTSVGYLYDPTDKIGADDIDTRFLAGPGEKTADFAAYHTYGGYYGFFRPDMREVCILIRHNYPDLSGIERIYVTTEPKGEGKPAECYDSKMDRHIGITTVYVIRKAPVK